MTDILTKAKNHQKTYRDVARTHYIAANRYTAQNRIFGVASLTVAGLKYASSGHEILGSIPNG